MADDDSSLSSGGASASSGSAGSATSSYADKASSSKWSDSSTAKGLKAAGGSLSQAGTKQISDAADRLAAKDPGVPSFKKGGRVKKTGLIKAHRGEEVVKKADAKKVRRFLGKKDGRSDEKMDDPKATMRKGDPKREAKKHEPARMEKKEDVKRTMRKGSAKRMSGKKAKKGRMAGRSL